MRPTSIPDELVEPGTLRKVISAPNGDLLDENIRPVEALISRDPATQLAAFRMRLVLEGGELEDLQAGKPIWLTMLGGIAPFDVQVEGS
ncbi:hypothetical protein GCM10009740_31530 [Terrabacter terrae]|uniref:Uncharacterized protein n=1 Tax=Terrabacter terrae TaxID=318434 RepID=A0ABN2UI58_9MICO